MSVAQRVFLGMIGISALLLVMVSPVSAYVRVRGYTRNSGTYVAPHYRSNSNFTRYDNWSTRGNVNPYTGRRGSRSVGY